MIDTDRTYEHGIACGFDFLKSAACNTENSRLSETLDDLADEFLDYAPEYKRQWVDIVQLAGKLAEQTKHTDTWRALTHKHEQTILDLKHQIAQLSQK